MTKEPLIQKHSFHVTGMHCHACELLIEDELKEVSEIESVHASLSENSVTIRGAFADLSREELSSRLSERLKKHGYTLLTGNFRAPVVWSEFYIAIPVATTLILGFVILQKLGIVNLVNASTLTGGTAFLIGVIASLSTCMAVVGGVVLSLSAGFAREGVPARSQLIFHGSRLAAFFLLGGVIGAAGSMVALSRTTSFVISVMIAFIMIVLGLHLLAVFSWTRKVRFSMPALISKKALLWSRINHSFTPLVAGIATFFLPCGFTQSMQFYTLSTGSFLAGATTMLFFALGTLPVLALISFSSYRISTGNYSGVFLKTAGILVIVFALFNLANSLAAIGVIRPLFSL